MKTINMKQSTRMEYSAPEAELIKVSINGVLMQSGLDDYGDNPIFGEPDITEEYLDDIIIF